MTQYWYRFANCILLFIFNLFCRFLQIQKKVTKEDLISWGENQTWRHSTDEEEDSLKEAGSNYVLILVIMFVIKIGKISEKQLLNRDRQRHLKSAVLKCTTIFTFVISAMQINWWLQYFMMCWIEKAKLDNCYYWKTYWCLKIFMALFYKLSLFCPPKVNVLMFYLSSCSSN